MTSAEVVQNLRDALAGLSGARAKRVAEELSARTSLSLRQVYKLTRDVRSTRKQRADSGLRRCLLPRETLDVLMKLCHELGFDASLAIDTALGNGLLAAEDAPSPATLNRWMRIEGIGASTPDTARVSRRWEASAPNDLHQADSTISNTWYLDDDGSLGYESLADQSNKPGNRKPRLNLFVLVDDYSRVNYARYYLAENTLNWLDFLWHAWREKDDAARFPFAGVPHALYTDNGSCLNSARFKTALAALGVELKCHEPYHAQSKGKVERAIRSIQQKLERLYLLGKPRSLDEANAVLMQFLERWNMRVHASTRVQPFQRWLDRSSELRRLPADEILRALNCTRIERVLGVDLTFSVAGETFQAPYQEPFRSMPRGQKIVVEYAPECPFEVNLVLGHSSVAAIHVPKGRPLPIALPAASDAITQTSATEKRLKAVGLEGLTPFGALDVPREDVRFLPQTSTPIEVRADVPELELTEVATMRVLQDAGICARPADAEASALVAWLLAGKDRIPQSVVSAVLRDHRGRAAREVLLALGGGTTAASAG